MATKSIDPTESVEDLYGSYDSESTGGLFLKFKDDEEVRVRIATEPYILLSRFEDKKTGEVTDSKRYAWTVINRADGKAAILQLPGGGYDTIASLVRDKEDWGNPVDYDLKITRKNNNGKYTYQINGSPKRSAITEDEMKAILEVDMIAAIGKNSPIMSLRDYVKAGKKFPSESAMFEADGTPIIQNLPEDDSNPLDSLPE